jgi:phage repressor protein C with HTH and peptisase S24 domain
MDVVRELIRAIIEERGLSMAALSTGAGKNHAYLQQFLERGVPKRLPEDVRQYLAVALAIDESMLKEGRVQQKLNTPRPKTGITPSFISAQTGRSEGPQDLLSVLGMAEGGPDGWNLWNGDVIETIRRPDNLVGVPGAYAVYVSGTSMEPRYHPGEKAHIHPGKPVLPGAYVLVQRKPIQEGEPPLAIIKRLVRRTASKVTLEQLNPKKQFDVPASDIVSIHKVVGSSED